MSGRPLPLEDLEEEGPPAPLALPPLCVRRLQTGRRYGCDFNCPGQQPDGSCLCDIAEAEWNEGRQPLFEIDKDGYWCLLQPEATVVSGREWVGWDGE